MSSAVDQIGLPLSPGGMGLLLFCIAGIAAIVVFAKKEFRAEMKQRATLLDAAAALLGNPRVTIGPDGYPRLTGTASGGELIRMEVVVDSLVPRRLPQMWLKLRLVSPDTVPRSSIGVLARPVGTEFYSDVLGLPDAVSPTFKADFSMLMRGRDVTDAAALKTSGLFSALFSDPALKEALIAPHGAGIVRQVAEGDLGAHVFYRQMRFPVTQVPAALVRKALAELELLHGALDASQETGPASRMRPELDRRTA